MNHFGYVSLRIEKPLRQGWFNPRGTDDLYIIDAIKGVYRAEKEKEDRLLDKKIKALEEELSEWRRRNDIFRANKKEKE